MSAAPGKRAGRAPAGGAAWRDAAVVVALGLAVAAVYGATGGFSFVHLDDDAYVFANPIVQRGWTMEGLIAAFTRFQVANWHPLTWASHMLDAELFGASQRSAGAHHLVSVALHAASAAILYLALRRMTGDPWRCAWVAALFAVHPLRVESVAWVAERKDVLSGLFFMLALLAYARYARRPGPGAYALVLVFALLGLLSKPMLVTLPFVLLLLDVWPLRRWTPFGAPRPARPGAKPTAPRPAAAPLGRLLLEKAPLFAMVAGAIAATLAAQGGAQAMVDLAWPWRIVTPALAYVTYVGKTLWPANLAVYYVHPGTLAGASPASFALPAAAAILALAAATVAVVRGAARFPWAFTGWFWFLGMLVPVVGLLQVGGQFWADRYAYLPTIGLYLMAAWGTGEFVARRPAARPITATLALAAIVASAVAARAQVAVWRDSRTLFEHALRVTRDNWMIENNLGSYLSIEDPASMEARRHLEASVRIRPVLADSHANLALVLSNQGEIDAARAHWSRALELDPGHVPARVGLGSLKIRERRFAEARADFEAALRADPANPRAHTMLGVALAATGERAPAREHLDEALRLDPRSAPALNALARWHATAPAAGPEDLAEAERLAARAVQESEQRRPEFITTLVVILATEGKLGAAIEWQRRLVEMAGPAERGAQQALLQELEARAADGS